MEKKVLIYGGGGHGKVVVDCLLGQADVIGVIDEKHEGPLLGIQRFKSYAPGHEADAGIIIAIGDNQTRKRIRQTIQHSFANAVHRSACLSVHSSIGEGCMILHNTVIQAGAVVGSHVIVNTGAQVDHDCVIGDFVHLAPRSVLCGSVSVGEGTLVGAGATIIPGIKIGSWATIGAGAVVIHDVPDHAVVVGNPAKILKYNSIHGF